MFSRKEQLLKKTGEFGIGRYDFLRQLIHEFTTTTSYENKKQTLANLANFAYDPINYDFIKQLHLIDLFLSELSNDQEEFIHFALAGLCNISCDPESQAYIVSLNGIKLISNFILHKNEEISLNALTTLYYLFESKNVTVSKELESIINKCAASKNSELSSMSVRRFSNIISKIKTFSIGDQVTISRQIKKEDIETFTLLSGDTNPIHSTNGQETGVVHGAFLNSIVSSVIGTKLPGPGTIVVQQTLNFPSKCFVGETVNTTVKIVENRKIIKVEFNCDVDQKKIVLYGSAKLVINK